MEETTTEVYDERRAQDDRRALEDTIQRLKDDQDRIFRNVAGVFEDAVETGDMEADLALEMLSNAGIPERYWDHIGMVDVDVEVTIRATVVYTTTVQTKVRRDQIDDHDVAYDNIVDDGFEPSEVLEENNYDLEFEDEDWQVDQVSEV